MSSASNTITYWSGDNAPTYGYIYYNGTYVPPTSDHRADLMVAAMDWRDALDIQGGSEGVALIEAVLAKDKALERAKAALRAGGGAAVWGLDALRLWKRITCVTGLDLLVDAEEVEGLRKPTATGGGDWPKGV